LRAPFQITVSTQPSSSLVAPGRGTMIGSLTNPRGAALHTRRSPIRGHPLQPQLRMQFWLCPNHLRTPKAPPYAEIYKVLKVHNVHSRRSTSAAFGIVSQNYKNQLRSSQKFVRPTDSR
jgi:hypothetical protein